MRRSASAASGPAGCAWERSRRHHDHSAVGRLRPASDDAPVPPGGRAAVPVRVEQLWPQVAEVEIAALPAHRRRIEGGKEHGPRLRRGHLLGVVAPQPGDGPVGHPDLDGADVAQRLAHRSLRAAKPPPDWPWCPARSSRASGAPAPRIPRAPPGVRARRRTTPPRSSRTGARPSIPRRARLAPRCRRRRARLGRGARPETARHSSSPVPSRAAARAPAAPRAAVGWSRALHTAGCVPPHTYPRPRRRRPERSRSPRPPWPAWRRAGRPAGSRAAPHRRQQVARKRETVRRIASCTVTVRSSYSARCTSSRVAPLRACAER